MTMNAPLLQNIGFGLYSYSSAMFDNIHVYLGSHRPEPQVDDTVFYDNFTSYNLDSYVATGGLPVEWHVENERLYGHYYGNGSSDRGWLMTNDLEVYENLHSYTIEVDYDIQLTYGTVM